MKYLIILLTAIYSVTAFAQPGTLDPAFDPETGASYWVFTTSIQSDGKIIIGGWFSEYNGTVRNRIARLNEDGTLDNTFDPGTGTNNHVWITAIQSDGKVIIGGSFTEYNGTARNRIARLNADGTLDNTFDPGTGANDNVLTTTIQSDGKIIIGGIFFSYNGTDIRRIARLNTDGSLDNTFDPETGVFAGVLTSAIQNDEKIIIGGNFFSYNGTARNRIARLNTDGSLDTIFDPETGANDWVRTSTIQSDGKIIIGGRFTEYNGTARNYIARLNADGSLDTTFNPGTGADDEIITTSIQSDGKIIIGGRFTEYNGTARNRIARLNSDGSLDTIFDPGTGAEGDIFTTTIQSDGKIIIGGEFTEYNGTNRNRIARILDDTYTGIESKTDHSVTLYPNPTIEGNITIDMGKMYPPQTNITVLNVQGQVVKTHRAENKKHIHLTLPDTAGIYIVKVTTGANQVVYKVVRE